ncbi:MAG: exopolyphosphatase, partial [Ellagibacter isourolithinifaciens]|nr:exopolyphosphatase [Ellagibacter isourolithinifaciens]
KGTVVDLGGGSTELIRVEEGRDFDDVSIGQGSLSSYAGYVEFVMPQADEVEAIERAFLDQVAKTPVDLKKYRAETLYGVGGSTRAAAKLYAQMTGESCRPKTLTPEHFDALLDLLENNPSKFAHLAARAVPERIHTVGPGCVILSTLMQKLDARKLEICKRGVREGYLIERMLGNAPCSRVKAQ